MSKISIIFLILAFSVFFSACEKGATESRPPIAKTSPSAVPTLSIPKDGNYNGKGIVTKINQELGSIELKHEEIKDLMPAMQMEFYVTDKNMLKEVKVGDKVDFVVEYKHPSEKVSSIKKVQ